MTHHPPIRLGIIGTGQVATRHLAPAISSVPGAELHSVCSRSLNRAQVFAQAHTAVHAFDQLELFLADPALDAVIIATPDASHAPQAIAAMRAGKHVFIEKPMATTVEDARTIAELQALTHLHVQVGYHLRHHAGHRLLRSLLCAGTLGEIRSVRISWSFTMPPSEVAWRAHGPEGTWWVLSALGTHCIDLAQWLVGREDHAEILGLSSNTVHGARDEQALVIMQFPDGPLVDIHVSGLLQHRRRIIEILTVSDGTPMEILCTETLGARGAGRITINGEPLAFDPVDPYAAELTAFVQAICSTPHSDAQCRLGLRNVEYLTQLS